MLTLYMGLWSLIIIGALSLWRVRRPAQLIAILIVTMFVLLLSQTLFLQLSQIAGIPIQNIDNLQPAQYLQHGLFGWLALLILPCGWLGPMIGLNAVKKWELLA